MQRPCANVYVHHNIYTVMCDTVVLGLAYIYMTNTLVHVVLANYKPTTNYGLMSDSFIYNFIVRPVV